MGGQINYSKCTDPKYFIKEVGESIQKKHHKKMLRLRRLDRLIQEDDFIAAWKLADEFEVKIALGHIEIVEIECLRVWIKLRLYKELKGHTYKELRNLAARHHIKRYSRMDRKELISKLIEKGITDDKHIEPA